MVVEFSTSKKVRAVKRALDFWYRNLRGTMSLTAFLSCCDWLERDGQPLLVYDSGKAEDGNLPAGE